MQAFVVADCTQREVNMGRASIQHLGRNLFSQSSKVFTTFIIIIVT